jgi:hypothetical protein
MNVLQFAIAISSMLILRFQAVPADRKGSSGYVTGPAVAGNALIFRPEYHLYQVTEVTEDSPK